MMTTNNVVDQASLAWLSATWSYNIKCVLKSQNMDYDTKCSSWNTVVKEVGSIVLHGD
jgi:hypothetical protein